MAGLRRIGVLGGMGPQATVSLMQRIQAATPASDDADHAPLLVDMNPQVPSRIRHLIDRTGTDPGPVLADMAVRLQTAGAEALIMPCNTAHHYADHITNRVSIPFLNMPVMACDTLAGLVPNGAKIGILASPATNRTGLFQALLAERGLHAIWPDDQDAMLAAIQRIKVTGPTVEDVDALQHATTEMTDRGAAAILIGCTEFSLVTADLSATIPIIDALDVLVKATLQFSGVNG